MFKIYNMKQKIIHIILYIAVLFVCVSITGYLKPVFKEGMNTFYDNRPSSKEIYRDDGVEITELGNYGKCLIINNEIQLCSKDEHIYHEMIVHLPVQYLRNNIEYVTIVGGGDLMTLREVMKYKTIKKVFMLEISKEIVELCKDYFSQSGFEDDDRVEIIYGDANITIDDIIQQYKYKMDMVIVDTTEDNLENLSIDSPDFFMKCFMLLQENGLLVKNGMSFKSLFQSYDDLNTISYNVEIPYFQEKYYFTIVSKPNNDIRKIDIEDTRWVFFNIKTKYYDINQHNSYLIHEDYTTEYDHPEENVPGYNIFFENQEKVQQKLNPSSYRDNRDDIFENLL